MYVYTTVTTPMIHGAQIYCNNNKYTYIMPTLVKNYSGRFTSPCNRYSLKKSKKLIIIIITKIHD